MLFCEAHRKRCRLRWRAFLLARATSLWMLRNVRRCSFNTIEALAVAIRNVYPACGINAAGYTKVESGIREHIDYVPTHVVTECFRTAFRHGGTILDGIIHPSTQNPGGHSLVLFATRHSVMLSPSEIKEAATTEKIEEWLIRSYHEASLLKLVRRRDVRMPQ